MTADSGSSRRYVARVRRFVKHLRAQGLVPTSCPVTQPIPATLNGFREWLCRHRGLANCTITRYELLVAKMLPALGEDPAGYDAALIRRVFLAHIRGLSWGYARCFVPALRGFLRFLAVEGRCRRTWTEPVRSYRWQPHCRGGLYQTPMAA